MSISRDRLMLILAVAFAALVWWVAFLAQGAHDYADAMRYSANAASISRSMELAPAGVDWESFASGAELEGSKVPLANSGYVLLLSGVYKMFGPELWHGSLISFVFFVFGAVFMALLMRRFLSGWLFGLCFALTVCNGLMMANMARPLTDPMFFGLSMFMLWFSQTYPRRVVMLGLIIGLTALFRLQAVFYFPIALILSARELTFKSVISSGLRLCVGGVAMIIGLVALKSLFATGGGDGAGFYGPWLKGLVQSFSPWAYVRTFNTSLQSITSLFSLTPLFWIASAGVMVRTEKQGVLRLRWFLVLGVISLVAAYAMNRFIIHRYLMPFLPLVALLYMQMMDEVVSRSSDHARLKRGVGVAVLLACFGVGPMLLAVNASTMSWTNVSTGSVPGLKKALFVFDEDSVLATNNPTRLALTHPVKNIVILPEDADDFVSGPERNEKIDGLVIVLNRLASDPSLELDVRKAMAAPAPDIYLYDGFHTWESVLTSNVVEDVNGNRFRKVHEQRGPVIQAFVYEAVR